jgi:integrase
VIYLPTLALKALRAHQAERHEQGFVFTAADGRPLRKSNFIRRVFKPLLKLAELPDVTFHSLRHTANSLLIEAGEDPLAIGQFGARGHADDVRAVRPSLQPHRTPRCADRGPNLRSPRTQLS